MKVTAIILAGGKGTRMKAGKNKVFLQISGREVLHYTISAFEWDRNIDDIIIVTAADDMEECQSLVKNSNFKKVRCITEGGKTRRQSVFNGLKHVNGDIVLIHDGARALVLGREIDNAIEDCMRYGAAAVGVRCKDTLKSSDKNGFILGTIDRESTYLIQTPQAFKTEEIRRLHEKADGEGFEATDDCMIAEHYGVRIKISEGSYENIKLTTPEDMLIAENILRNRGEIE